MSFRLLPLFLFFLCSARLLSAQDSLAEARLQALKKQASQQRDSGAFEKAQLSLDSAITLLSQLKVNSEVATKKAWLWANKAYIASQYQGSFVDAKTYYLEALNLLSPLGKDSLLIARHIYNPLGNIYTRLGEYEHAISLFEKSLAIGRDLKHHSLQMEASNDLAIALLENDSVDASIRLLNGQLNDVKNTPLEIALLKSNLAKAYLKQEKTKEAKEVLLEAIPELETILHDSLQQNLHRHALSYLLGSYSLLLPLENPEKTRETFLLALQYSKSLYGDKNHRKQAKLYLALAEAYHRQQETRKALYAYEHAEELLKSLYPNTIYPEQLLVECIQGKIACFSALIPTNSGYADSIAQQYDFLFELEVEVRSELLNSSSRSEHVMQFHEIGAKAVNFALTRSKVDSSEQLWIHKALEYATYAKGILFDESRIKIQLNQLFKDSNWLQLRELEKRMAYLRNESKNSDSLRILVQDKALLLHQLKVQKPHVFQSWYSTKKLDVQRLLAKLEKENAALLDVFDDGEALRLFWIQDQKVSYESIAMDSSLTKLIHEWNQQIAEVQTPASEFQEHAHQLYQLLLGKFKLKTPTDLTIIADGRLHQIRFELLIPSLIDEANYRKLNYWFKNQAINYCPTLPFYLNELEKRNYQENQVTFRPSFECDEELVALPGLALNQLEGKTIAKQNANIESFLNYSGRSQITYLATHGYNSTKEGQKSWIAFSGSDTCQHSKLFFEQIEASGYASDLIILQACQAGSGYFLAGDGIHSVANGFLRAGSNAVIASKWDANPEASNQLLGYFLRELKDGNLANGLSQARLKYLNSENVDELATHPYYWGAWSIYGKSSFKIQTESNRSRVIPLLVLGSVVLGFLLWRKFKA